MVLSDCAIEEGLGTQLYLEFTPWDDHVKYPVVELGCP